MADDAENLRNVRQLAEAAAWRVRLTESGADSCEAFEAWIAVDPAHAAAWAKVQAMWSYFHEHAEAREMLEARDEILAQARPNRIVGDSQGL